MSKVQRPYIQHGSKLTLEKVQQWARFVLLESEYTQQEMADELGVTRVAIAKAATTPGRRYFRLQKRILEKLTDYELEKQEKVRIRPWRKDEVDNDRVEV